MVEFINRLTGSKMRVADERKQEYLEAGHKLASEPVVVKPKETEKAEKRKKK